jgi:hypothetical protein
MEPNLMFNRKPADNSHNQIKISKPEEIKARYHLAQAALYEALTTIAIKRDLNSSLRDYFDSHEITPNSPETSFFNGTTENDQKANFINMLSSNLSLVENSSPNIYNETLRTLTTTVLWHGPLSDLRNHQEDQHVQQATSSLNTCIQSIYELQQWQKLHGTHKTIAETFHALQCDELKARNAFNSDVFDATKPMPYHEGFPDTVPLDMVEYCSHQQKEHKINFVKLFPKEIRGEILKKMQPVITEKSNPTTIISHEMKGVKEVITGWLERHKTDIIDSNGDWLVQQCGGQKNDYTLFLIAAPKFGLGHEWLQQHQADKMLEDMGVDFSHETAKKPYEIYHERIKLIKDLKMALQERYQTSSTDSPPAFRSSNDSYFPPLQLNLAAGPATVYPPSSTATGGNATNMDFASPFR